MDKKMEVIIREVIGWNNTSCHNTSRLVKATHSTHAWTSGTRSLIFLLLSRPMSDCETWNKLTQEMNLSNYTHRQIVTGYWHCHIDSLTQLVEDDGKLSLG